MKTSFGDALQAQTGNPEAIDFEIPGSVFDAPRTAEENAR